MTSAAPIDTLLGSELGRYRLERLLGEGGMGRVYLGVQPAIGSRVAIKVLSDECARDPVLLERFFSEARAVNTIRHEHIANVIDLAQLPDGRPYIVMEFIDGRPLSSLVRSGLLPLGGVVQVVGETLAALAAAHAVGIVHRDLKPDNVMVTAQGHAKVLDFGIAKLGPGLRGGNSPRTATGALLGTPAYMSPEQIAGSQDVDARTDVYAAGVVLYECVTGRPPFAAATLFELMRAHLEQAPTPPRALRPDLPEAIEHVILQALAKRPDERYAHAGAMAAALHAASAALPAEQWRALTAQGDAAMPPHARASAGGMTERSLHPPLPPPPPHPHSLPPAPGTSTPPAAPASATATPWRSIMAAVVIIALAVVVGVVVVSLSHSEARRSETVASPSASASPSPSPSPVVPPPTVVSAPAPTPAPTAPARIPAAAATSPVPAAGPAIAVHGGHVEIVGGLVIGKGQAIESLTVTAPPAAPAAPGAAPTTLHVPPTDYVPSHFDPVAYLPRATAIARQLLPDARFTEFEMYEDVWSDGHVDLTIPVSDSAYYEFRSPSKSARPATLPANLTYERACYVMVEVTAQGLDARVRSDDDCNHAVHATPRCPLAEVWRRAVADGEPHDNLVATIGYLHDGTWFFDLDHAGHHPGKSSVHSYPDDCGAASR